MDAMQEDSQRCPEATAQQLQDLNSLGTTEGFLLVLLVSGLLSFFATGRQREAICCQIAGKAKKAEELANVIPIRCAGTALAIGSAGYLLTLALRGRAQLGSDASDVARCSAELSILEAILVLGATVVRMTNLTVSRQLSPESTAVITEEQEPA